jgi:hypothetical protein
VLHVDRDAFARADAHLVVVAGGDLRNANATSASTRGSFGIGGSWGDVSQPRFLATFAVVAVDSGGNDGLGAGDTMLLRFNQPVFPVPVATTAQLLQLLQFSVYWFAEATGTRVGRCAIACTHRLLVLSSPAPFRGCVVLCCVVLSCCQGGGTMLPRWPSLCSQHPRRLMARSDDWWVVVNSGLLYSLACSSYHRRHRQRHRCGLV